MSYDFFDEEEMIELRFTRPQFEDLVRLVEYVADASDAGTESGDAIRVLLDMVQKKEARLWQSDHDQEAACADQECGHPYRRHFDSYEFNLPVGCKYCQCFTFKEQA